jgi:plastocyanin
VRRILVAAIVGGLLLLSLPSAGATRDGKRIARAKPSVVQAAVGTVPLTWAWDPPDITIRTGDRVRWENPTTEAHSVLPWVEEGDPSPPWGYEQPLEPGGSVTLRFKEPGAYTYRCGIGFHSDVVYLADGGRCVGMCGVITVE